VTPDRQVKLGGEGGSCTGGLGVVISMTGGVEGGERDLKTVVFFFFFFFLFFYIISSLLRYKKSLSALAMAKTKPKIQNELTKETSGTILPQLGSVPVPGPHTGAKLKQVH